MKIAIMQPYFLPYIGYFQLLNAVDEFVVYDNIKYTKKGWINRNRILVNGQAAPITLPLKKGSDFLDVKDRFLADSWPVARKKLLNKIKGAYLQAPRFSAVYPLIEKIVLYDDPNLFNFIFNSLEQLKDYLRIKTPLVVSSLIPVAPNLKAEKKILKICAARQAEVYLNPVGGLNLYNRDEFQRQGVNLSFLKSAEIKYNQAGNDFVPWLSIVDVLMFNEPEKIKEYLNDFVLI